MAAPPGVFSGATYPPLLAFDFTDFPRADGKGMCSAKGVIPEPSDETLANFLNRCAVLRPPQRPGALGGLPVEMRLNALRRELVDIIEWVAGGALTRAEVQQLPLRVMVGFVSALGAQLDVPAVVGIGQ